MMADYYRCAVCGLATFSGHRHHERRPYASCARCGSSDTEIYVADLEGSETDVLHCHNCQYDERLP